MRKLSLPRLFDEFRTHPLLTEAKSAMNSSRDRQSISSTTPEGAVRKDSAVHVSLSSYSIVKQQKCRRGLASPKNRTGIAQPFGQVAYCPRNSRKPDGFSSAQGVVAVGGADIGGCFGPVKHFFKKDSQSPRGGLVCGQLVAPAPRKGRPSPISAMICLDFSRSASFGRAPVDAANARISFASCLFDLTASGAISKIF